MSTLSAGEIGHIFEELRKGAVPTQGLDAFAVGIEAERAEIARQLEHVAHGEGTSKFLRGGYGCGKTFMARLTQIDAWAQGFATSFVVVGNDLRFHNFEDLYARIVSELSTETCRGGALGDILDRWIGAIEERLIDGGADDESPEFAAQVRTRIGAEVERLTAGKAPLDFVRVIQRLFDLKEAGDFANAGALLSWLSGSRNVGSAAKRAAGIKGDITKRDALNYLRGVVEIVRAAGYRGLAIIVDETETLSHGRTDTLRKALNGLRHLVDKAGEFPGLLWVFTGTPEFFDDPRRGVAKLQPLHDRIRFSGDDRFINLRQPQLRLRPFDADRLTRVAHVLRDLYPSQEAAQRVTDAFIDRLVREVTAGFGGDVGIVPRQFLREVVNVLDKADQYADFDPMAHYEFKVEVDSETDEERAHRTGIKARVEEDADDLVAEEEEW